MESLHLVNELKDIELPGIGRGDLLFYGRIYISSQQINNE